MNLNLNFDGKTKLKDWWKQVKGIFQQVQADVNTESAARQKADEALQEDIKQEAQMRKSNDDALLSSINTEKTARQEADKTLQNNLESEANFRQISDNTLQSGINNEKTARENADNTHKNAATLDHPNGSVTEGKLSPDVKNKLEHNNREILDNITAGDIHTHENRNELDSITWEVLNNSHAHANKNLLDGLTQNLIDQIPHWNKMVLDEIQRNNVDSWNAAAARTIDDLSGVFCHDFGNVVFDKSVDPDWAFPENQYDINKRGILRTGDIVRFKLSSIKTAAGAEAQETANLAINVGYFSNYLHLVHNKPFKLGQDYIAMISHPLTWDEEYGAPGADGKAIILLDNWNIATETKKTYKISELERENGYYQIPVKPGDYFYIVNNTVEPVTELYYNDDVKYNFSAKLKVGETYPCLMLQDITSTIDDKIDGLFFVVSQGGINNLMLANGCIAPIHLNDSLKTKINQAHIHNNKLVLDSVTQTQLDKLDGIPRGADPGMNDRDDNYNNILYWFYDGDYIYPINIIVNGNRIEYGSMTMMIGNGYFTSNIGCDGYADFGPGNVIINQTPGEIDCTRINTNGADNAKYFEWVDGNPAQEDRIGLFVALEGDKIRPANANDTYILGIVSGMASNVGNAYESYWNGRYLRDIYGRTITNQEPIPAKFNRDGEQIAPAYMKQVPVVNPAYNPKLEYIPRSQRPEWDIIGISGIMVVRDDGSCAVNGYCQPADGGVATAADEPTPYRVLSRLDGSHIKIYVK